MATPGQFGEFGGRHVPEPLEEPLAELAAAYEEAIADDAFMAELRDLLEHFAGRPTPVFYAETLSERYGADIYLKHEDLLHGGAHKLNNTLGQALLAKRAGKDRLIAETGAGQHGTATAMVGALLNLDTTVYMGRHDMQRQEMNVFRFPRMVREFQSVIGEEAREQIQDLHGDLPDACVACVGGGSNSIGLWHAFKDDDVAFYGAEPGGTDDANHSAPLSKTKQDEPQIFQGMKTKTIGDDTENHSISAGLDYPAIGPEHAALQEMGRAEYHAVSDDEALAAFRELSEAEGIIPALEPAHALALAAKLAEEDRHDTLLVNLSE